MNDRASTGYTDVDELLPVLVGALRETLGEKLVGVGIFGSVVTGAYETGISDVDTVAALTGELDAEEGDRLTLMHAGIVKRYPAWRERVEVGYLSVATMGAFRQGMPMGRISPGEPFHLTTAGAGWLFNLASLRERGIGVWGREPREFVAPISPERLRTGLGALMRDWEAYLAENPAMEAGEQGYLVLTMCRARAMAERGMNLGKLEAAEWAAATLPGWATLIRTAVAWRRATALGMPIPDDPVHPATEVVEFARESIGTVLGRLSNIP